MNPSKASPASDGSSGIDPAGSVSKLIDGLKGGDRDAVAVVWQRYFQPLVRIASRVLHQSRQHDLGPEDVATKAFLDFCAVLTQPDVDHRFPQLQNRKHLWKLLVRFTTWEASDVNTKQQRRFAVVAGESALGEAGLAPVAGREPAPEFALAVDELIGQLQGNTPKQTEALRRTALLRLEGYTNEEIADSLSCSLASVERKLKAIRTLWENSRPEERP